MHTHDPIGTATRQIAQRMGEAADNFLAALSPDQRAKSQLDFANHAQRTDWHYTPTPRYGLPLGEMDRNQQRLAQRLITTGLSRVGWVTASAIIGLEIALDVIEGWTTQLWWRDPRLYFVTVFGQPDSKGTWGWKFEGHHISINYTIANGQLISPTPTFFGSNPAEAQLIGTNTLRPLAGIEDKARELMHLFSEEQQAIALLTPVAPPDIVTMNRPYVLDGSMSWETPGIVDSPSVQVNYPSLKRMSEERGVTLEDMQHSCYTNQPRGLGSATMNAAQRELLHTLIGEYLQRMPDELAEIERQKLQAIGMESLHFAWAGGLQRRQPHYYRIQSPRFLVEYDCTQNGANHIHSVWRDPVGDFGADVLAQHYAKEHKH